MNVDPALTPAALTPQLERLFALAAEKVDAIEREYPKDQGTPVFTVQGKYTTRGWTEWTQGFTYGCALLVFDGTGREEYLELGRRNTLERMASHVTHVGVHDHGFNNVSTYGNLLRLMAEGRIPTDPWERHFHELALKCSGAVQARRWTRLADGSGFICSFNGPHSLFADTIRSLRSLAVAHQLGHVLMEEQDLAVNLLERLLGHARTTSKYIVYFGEGRDHYDLPGRVVHEAIFNLNNGVFRCPSSQQGFSPFSTWTRGQSWVLAGYPEELEWLATRSDDELAPFGGRQELEASMLRTARAVADFWLERTPADGIPYWDTGAPELHRLGDWTERPADPFNAHEPVDSSAAAIAAQGLLRLGHYLGEKGQDGSTYTQAGLTIARALFAEPYLSTDPSHQGLILHSVYHRPNGWDHVPAGQQVPCGESSMWGDYHALELAVYLQRLATGGPYHRFFNI